MDYEFNEFWDSYQPDGSYKVFVQEYVSRKSKKSVISRKRLVDGSETARK